MSSVAGLRVDGCRVEVRVGDARTPAGALMVFPFFFSLVLVLQLPQQRARENHGQEETHEKGEGDINRYHQTRLKHPPILTRGQFPQLSPPP